MELSYKKNDNVPLFSSFKNLEIDLVQNYVPIYDRFFSLKDTTYNNINLNQKYKLVNVEESIDKYTFKCLLKDDTNNKSIEKPVFFKYGPLLDPVKYLVGKYNESSVVKNFKDINNPLMNLPKYNAKDCHEKVLDPNNSAYVDAFATYLISELLHKHDFINALDFYGSFLGIKNNFMANLDDDLEYLYDSDEFHKNKDILFTLINDFHEDMMNINTRNNKKPLSLDNDVLPDNILALSDIKDLTEIDKLFIEPNHSKANTAELLFEINQEQKENLTRKSHSCSTSSCSSRSSHTNNSNDSSSEVSSDEESSDETCSTATEDSAFACIKQFPVQIIALEKCENTLDRLLLNNEISDRELSSAIMQIIMSLMVFENTYEMTHNDLHTNNIMYITTKQKFLCYKYKNIYYKVPTYGKIYKIIDFGRAIYKYKGVQMCSDSFHPKGDAATQYNTEPYYNEKKSRLEPNYSFDLCRLGCSMYDFIIEDINDDLNEYSEIERIIVGWCYDDKERNILYKNNGDERYPDFKLYKMIARTVSKHTPKNVLNNPHFSKYIVNKKMAHKSAPVIDIDKIPNYSK